MGKLELTVFLAATIAICAFCSVYHKLADMIFMTPPYSLFIYFCKCGINRASYQDKAGPTRGLFRNYFFNLMRCHGDDIIFYCFFGTVPTQEHLAYTFFVIFLITLYTQSCTPGSFSGLGWAIVIVFFNISFGFYTRDVLNMLENRLDGLLVETHLFLFLYNGQFYLFNCFEDFICGRDVGKIASIGINASSIGTWLPWIIIEAGAFGMIYDG